MKKVSLIFGVITIVGIGYGVKRATSQQPVPIASDPSPSQLADAVRKARQSGFDGYQIVREEYLSCNGATKHASTQTDMKDSEAGKYFGLDRLDGNKRIEIRRPDGTIIVVDGLSKRKMTFLPIPGRSHELLLATFRRKITFSERLLASSRVGESSSAGDLPPSLPQERAVWPPYSRTGHRQHLPDVD